MKSTTKLRLLIANQEPKAKKKKEVLLNPAIWNQIPKHHNKPNKDTPNSLPYFTYKYMIGDKYPDADGYRRIIIYEMATGRTETLLDSLSPYPDDTRFFAPDPKASKEARCDLHARWNHDGTRVSFDTICRGHREIVEIDMTKLPF